MTPGCASVSGVSRTRSAIDAQFRLSRTERAAQPLGIRSPGVGFYQRILSQTLGSHCTMLPSDSQFAQTLMARCGSGVATLQAMARFYLEPDAATLGLPIVLRKSRIYFEDLPDDCALF